MYEAFFGLKAKPFQISTDPKFMWMGEKHQEALATLKYGILDSKGFLLLTGDVGTGKTTLLHRLLNTLDDNVLYAVVPNPGLETVDFFNFIARAFRMKRKHFSSKGAFLEAFDQFLKVAHNARKKVLLIIDEAQAIQPAMLEEIRLLSNIEKQHTKLLNIFFVGQNEFNEQLVTRQMRALRQRITLNYHVDPLTRSETAAYIRHRLDVAGATREIFAAAAMDEVMDFSKGYPRLINVICDHALLTGFVQEVKSISREIVRECAKELAIAVPTEHKEAHDEVRKKEAAQEHPDSSTPQSSASAEETALPDNPMKTRIPQGAGPLPPPPRRSPPAKTPAGVSRLQDFKPPVLERLDFGDGAPGAQAPVNITNRKYVEEIMAEFKPVDAKTFREGVDQLDLARSSVVRTSLTRIFRASVNIQELMRTMDLEAERILGNDEMIALKQVKERTKPAFLTVVIDLLWQEVAKKYMTRRAQKALRILSPTESFHITDFPQVLISR